MPRAITKVNDDGPRGVDRFIVDGIGRFGGSLINLATLAMLGPAEEDEGEVKQLGREIAVGALETLAETVVDDIIVDGSRGTKLIHVAKTPENVRLLVDNGANVNAQTRSTLETPLHVASKTGNSQVVETLLEKGADPRIPDIDGRTPLGYAVKNKDAVVVELLTSGGGSKLPVDPTEKIPLTEVSGTTRPGDTLIHVAARGKTSVDERILRALVAAFNQYFKTLGGDQIDLSVVTNFEGQTPLHAAAQNGSMANVAQLVAEDKSGKSSDARDIKDRTPLQIAKPNSVNKVILEKHAMELETKQALERQRAKKLLEERRRAREQIMMK